MNKRTLEIYKDKCIEEEEIASRKGLLERVHEIWTLRNIIEGLLKIPCKKAWQEDVFKDVREKLDLLFEHPMGTTAIAILTDLLKPKE